MNDDLSIQLARLEARAQQHADDLLEIKHDVKYLLENMAGIKVKLALVSSTVAVLVSQAVRLLF